MHHTRPPRTVRIVGSDGGPIVVDADLPKPGPCCKPGTVRQLCDTCWPPLRDHALRKGMPAYMVGQLRNRVYRMSAEEVAAAETTSIKVMTAATIDDHVHGVLVRKAALAGSVL